LSFGAAAGLSDTAAGTDAVVACAAVREFSRFCDLKKTNQRLGPREVRDLLAVRVIHLAMLPFHVTDG
jgi:hypothetical protein